MNAEQITLIVITTIFLAMAAPLLVGLVKLYFYWCKCIITGDCGGSTLYTSRRAPPMR